MKNYHFISGLPRSGSTLLSALLRQNPRTHASMSGPLAGLLGNLLSNMSAKNEYSVFISDLQRKRILRGVVENYYGPEFDDKELIFDTSRAWCSHLSLIQELLPDSKVIACVRDVSWIVDSVERLVLKNTFSPSSIFNYQSGGTVYTRADAVANGDGMLGFAYNALKQAFYGPHANHLMLVQYETLVNKPQEALDAIYQFIGQPGFRHDFQNVEFDLDEFDIKAGTPGLHTIRPVVAAQPRKTVLPPDVFRRFEKDAFWRNPELNPNGVTVI